MILIWKMLPNLEYGGRNVGLDCAYDKIPQSGWHLNYDYGIQILLY